jgi:hypothetical protein
MNIDFTSCGAVINYRTCRRFHCPGWASGCSFGCWQAVCCNQLETNTIQAKSEAPKPAAPKALPAQAVKNAMVVEDGISDEIVAVIAATVLQWRRCRRICAAQCQTCQEKPFCVGLRRFDAEHATV